MSDNRGIFSLEEFYDLQVSGEITNIFDPFRFVNSVWNTRCQLWILQVGGDPGPSSNPRNNC